MLREWLRWHGRNVASRPRATIACCVSLCVLALPGLLLVKVVTNPEQVWIPANSRVSNQKRFFDAAFTPFFRINQAIFTAVEEPGADPPTDLITHRHLQKLMDVQRTITSASVAVPLDALPPSALPPGFSHSMLPGAPHSKPPGTPHSTPPGASHGTPPGATGAAANVTLDDLCFKPIDGAGCLIESPAQYWLSDPVLLATDPAPALTAACQSAQPALRARLPCFDAIGTPVLRDVVFGGLGASTAAASPDPCGDVTPSARALILTVLLNNFQDDAYKKRAAAWERGVFEAVVAAADARLRNDVHTPMRVSAVAGRSVQDSLAAEARQNAWVVAASYAAMFVYVAAALGSGGGGGAQRKRRRGARCALAATGLVIVAASFAAAIAVLSACGLATTLIVWEVVPFFALAIGVDNEFLVAREFDRLLLRRAAAAAAADDTDETGGGGGGGAYALLSDAAADGDGAAVEVTQRGVDGGGGADSSSSDGGGGGSDLSPRESAATAHWGMWGACGRLQRSAAACAGRCCQEAAVDAAVAEVIGEALANVGPGILAAGACEVITFAVGALTNIPALTQFCLVAAATVLINFLLQLTWFVAALALDSTPTRNSSSAPPPPSPLPPPHHSLASQPPPHRTPPQAGGYGTYGFMERWYLPALLSRGGKAVTLLAAAALVACGGVGARRMPLGLEPQLAAPLDSPLQAYYRDQFALGEAGPPAYIVLTDIDYFQVLVNATRRAQVNDLVTAVSQLTPYVQPPIYSWLDAMTAWIAQRDALSGSDCPPQIDIATREDFSAMLGTFLTIPITSQCCQSHGICGAQFKSDVEVDAAAGEVRASRMRFNMRPLRSQRDFVNSFWYLQRAVSAAADGIEEAYPGQRRAGGTGNLAFPYSIYMVYYEQYAYIQAVAVQGVLLSLAVVFLIVLALLGAHTAAIVTLLELAMVTSIVGVLWLWGAIDTRAPFPVSINAVSVCNLIMAVGLSVEFLLHMAHAFAHAHGTREERAARALRGTGRSVFFGITLTKLVGVFVLAFAPSQLFRLYYFRQYMSIVAVGAFVGLAVLPVVLSLIGPAEGGGDGGDEGGDGGVKQPLLVEEPEPERQSL